jgi:hypothetical protein
MRTVYVLVGLTGCFGGASVEGQAPLECMDGLDNDGDGLFDCLDTDCEDSAECTETGAPTGTPTGAPTGTNTGTATGMTSGTTPTTPGDTADTGRTDTGST